MTNSVPTKFDDDEVNDDELLAACNDEIPVKEPEPTAPIGNFKTYTEISSS